MKFKKAQRSLAVGLLAAALVLVFGACSLAPASGSLRFGAPQSRELGLGDVTTWKISGTGPSAGEFSVQATDSSQDTIVDNLETGLWTITVHGFATGDVLIYSKTDSIDVFAGENALTITLDVLVQSISLSKTEGFLSLGATESLVATIVPFNATNKDLVWSSSDDAVATVDANGVVTRAGPGTATITVSSAENSSKFAEFSLLVVVDPLVLRWDFEDDTEPFKDLITQLEISPGGSVLANSFGAYNSDKGLSISDATYATIASNQYKDRSEPWAMSFWVNRSSDTEIDTLVSSSLGQSIFIAPGGIVGLRHEDSSTESFENTGSPLVQNTWDHIMVTSSGTEVQLFINGQQSGTPISSAFKLPLDGLGARLYPAVSEIFTGFMDDIRVYTRLPTAAEVATLFQSYPVRLTVNISGGGTFSAVPPADPNGYYEYGADVELTADPDNSYYVLSWIDSLTAFVWGGLNVLTINVEMDKNQEINLNFMGS